MRSLKISAALVACQLGRIVNAVFGLTSKGNSFSVDTNAGLVFEVSKSTGDITSLLYNGVQYQGTSKMTHLNSGLGSSKVTAETVNGYVKITIVAGSQPVTQYYVARPNDTTIYMATYLTGEINPGELRFLARLRRSAVPNGWHGDVAVLDGCTAFEGKDTFKCPNGQTRCKMYTSDRFIEDQVHGVTGKNVGIWMIMPGVAYETSSGGPFMRDINTQSGDDQELYWYMNSGHVRTEPWRFGLQGPYAMQFTTGAKPSPDLDTSFFSSLSIQGYVPPSQRGTTSGFATGVAPGFQPVLHWYNNASQYWTTASPNGSYTSPRMKPGTYTLTLYRNEFPIATSSVSITAGSNTPKNLTSTEPNPPVIWRIGSFDGQPLELKNGDKIERMHPEDVRMGSWGGNYTVGKSTARDFPMALFAKQGGVATVHFEVSAEQARAETTLRVGTTLSFKGGRPRVEVGGWTGRDPGAPRLIDSRGVTRGAYRGYGEVYAWKIPAGTMREGWNKLTLGVFGSGDAKFLSANYIVDAVELQGPVGKDSPM
ncbi:rhamnogalacturonase B [Podospora aff. communis PSN243]|uniref:rhamnogalacturonan endolyase n=1 Tax=Podospora aff. communis PSN243 TaxID=3040156 RepID=A0AAV9FYA5_9PEZI|nr:rhamnogalacturonase B [Podospora aff. communis PSN243]